jgi:uncharacterized protein
VRPVQVNPTGPSLARAIFVGIVAGLLSGLFGVGGGIILVPALVLVVGMGVRAASATSLATVVPIAMSGLVGYLVAGEVEVVLALWLAVGALIGTVVGTKLLRRLPERVLLGSFSLLLAIISIRLIQSQGATAAPGMSPTWVAAEAAGIGLVTGVLSGLFGVGGGFVIVPALVLLLGRSPALAKGTSLLAMLPPSVFGTILNTRRGLVDWRVMAGAGLAGAGFSYLTAGLSVGLDPAQANGWFAALLVAVSFRMAVLAYKHPLDQRNL